MPGVFCNSFCTTFCEACGGNPSIDSAATASSYISDTLGILLTNVEVVGFILSLRSTIILCAVFAPMPLTDFSTPMFSVATICSISSGESDDNIMRAVLGPTPDTEISNWKISRSRRPLNPYNTYASSRIASYTYNLACSPCFRAE